MGIHPECLSFLYFRPHKSDPRKFIFDVIVMVHPQDDPEVQPPAYMGLPEGWDISARAPAEIEEIDPRQGGLGLVFDQAIRSEEHTSELQSLMRLSYAVFCLQKKLSSYTLISPPSLLP